MIFAYWLFLLAALIGALLTMRMSRFPAPQARTDFRTGFSNAQAASRLAATCLNRGATAPGYRWMAGTVSTRKVVLHTRAVGDFRQNAWRPFYVGYFNAQGGVTVLRGSFRPALPTIVFMFAWFTGVAIGCLAVCQYLVVHPQAEVLLGLCFALGLLATGLGITRVR